MKKWIIVAEIVFVLAMAGVALVFQRMAAHDRMRAEQAVAEAKANAKAEGDRIIAGAKAEIDQEVNRAKEGLRQQVSLLAVAGAEKILRREIDAKAHSDMLNVIANEL